VLVDSIIARQDRACCGDEDQPHRSEGVKARREREENISKQMGPASCVACAEDGR